MFKKYFLPFLIILIFAFLIINLLKISVANDKNNTYLELVKHSTSDIFQLDSNIKICIFNNQETIKCNINKTLIDDDFTFKSIESKIFYKFKKIINNSEYQVVIAKNCTYNKSILNTFMIFGGSGFVLLILLYFLYKNKIKNLLWYKNTTNTFFNDAMHELKTPLGIAILNTNWLEDSKYKNRIIAALNQMKTTYEDVEFYIKNPKIRYKLNDIDFSTFLLNRIEFFKSIASVKNLEFKTGIKDNINIYISEQELQRIIDNNISNAIKYSNPNTIIKIDLFKKENKNYFVIENEGVGIKNTKTIWNRYKREDLAQGGFGIGLNIVRKICERYDIKYAAKSEEKIVVFTYIFN